MRHRFMRFVPTNTCREPGRGPWPTTKHAQPRHSLVGSAEIAERYLDQLLRAFVIVIAESNLGRRLRTLVLAPERRHSHFQKIVVEET